MLSQTSMQCFALTYRRDIDGLRAWAVGLVILFHAGIWPFHGGFIGVDVFFVISGYLITRLIASDTERGQFSLSRFYERRLRRILPALMVMMIITLLAGAALSSPTNLERMSKSSIASILFSSNIYFWRITSNYFAPSAEVNPFLHTWSLSVEEQFYLVFPILFAVSFKKSPKLLRAGCAVVGLASLVLAQYGNSIAPTADFFLAPTRAWEFLAGSLLALNAAPPVQTGWVNTLLTGFGLGLIVASSVTISSQDGFPGVLATAPVLGAALVIHCGGAAKGPVRVLLTARPIHAIGLISYSLYLWHWPVLVYAEHYIFKRSLGTLYVAAALGLALALAWISYTFVEQPFRRDRRLKPRRTLFAASAALTTVAFALACVGVLSDGLMARYPGLAEVSIDSQLASEEPARKASVENCFVRSISGQQTDGCVLAEPSRADAGMAMLWGDSFARHYAPALVDNAVVADGRGILSFVSSQCPPILGYDPVNVPACKLINDSALAQMKAYKVDTVILAANWLAYITINRFDFEDLGKTVAALQERGLQVVVIGQSPVYHFVGPVEPYYEHVSSGADPKRASAANGTPPDFNRELAARASADAFVDPAQVFCVGEDCVYHDEAGYMVVDYGHLTLRGSQRVAPALAEAISGLGSRTKPDQENR